MSDSKAHHVRCRARRPFLYQGHTIEPGDELSLPAQEFERLRAKPKRYVEHLLDKDIRARMHSTYRRGIEWHCD
jgi:hypothetical protein